MAIIPTPSKSFWWEPIAQVAVAVIVTILIVVYEERTEPSSERAGLRNHFATESPRFTPVEMHTAANVARR